MAAPSTTLALSRVLSPGAIRGLWLSLYASALTRGYDATVAIEVANRGTLALDAAVACGLDTLPEWLRECAPIRYCDRCNGFGRRPSPDPDLLGTVDCPDCDGSGKGA